MFASSAVRPRSHNLSMLFSSISLADFLCYCSRFVCVSFNLQMHTIVFSVRIWSFAALFQSHQCDVYTSEDFYSWSLRMCVKSTFTLASSNVFFRFIGCLFGFIYCMRFIFVLMSIKQQVTISCLFRWIRKQILFMFVWETVDVDVYSPTSRWNLIFNCDTHAHTRTRTRVPSSSIKSQMGAWPLDQIKSTR